MKETNDGVNAMLNNENQNSEETKSSEMFEQLENREYVSVIKNRNPRKDLKMLSGMKKKFQSSGKQKG